MFPFNSDPLSPELMLGHVQQSIALIASNAAAIFPAFWALRQKVNLTTIFLFLLGKNLPLYPRKKQKNDREIKRKNNKKIKIQEFT